MCDQCLPGVRAGRAECCRRSPPRERGSPGLSAGGLDAPAPLARPITQQVAEGLAERLRILGQPVRVRLLDRLELDGELAVGALAGALDERLHNVSRHLAILRTAGVVSRRHEGREVIYRLSDPAAIRVYEQVAAGLVRGVCSPGAAGGPTRVAAAPGFRRRGSSTPRHDGPARAACGPRPDRPCPICGLPRPRSGRRGTCLSSAMTGSTGRSATAPAGMRTRAS
jgi:DNA-binding transcriptional ArsR family regulator